ncbi:hypothetical protein T8J41_13740 [Nitratireductor rhodophyticola]|uniref:hypothetical protein n=1 Tax=Nitratireductor rhodophyticola TaxID=2854036 RepID=UPI002AC95541|nr:hypothetical protein [Nitratireductor rhodophyticola]WPZ13218.1 hypothetical protein T8J41_13740 [Nitratireductor rhodophyticola]
MEWLGLIGTISGVATAIFAGIGVYLIVMDRLDRIKAEFEFTLKDKIAPGSSEWNPSFDGGQPPTLHINATVTNGTSKPIRITELRAYGQPMEMWPGYDRKSVHRYKGNGIMRDVDEVVQPGRSVSVGLGVELDWRAIQSSLTSAPSASPIVRSSVIIDRMTRIVPTISRTDIKAIKADIIEKNAAKAAQK